MLFMIRINKNTLFPMAHLQSCGLAQNFLQDGSVPNLRQKCLSQQLKNYSEEIPFVLKRLLNSN
nr:MAG TPA: hypothetical protein [Caudoviricetes sp.]